MRDLSSIIKAYDVRGVVPDQWDTDVARAVGAAFARLTAADTVVTAHDMRATSPRLAAAFADAVTDEGVDVVQAGLGSTDMLYFAAGSMDVPGAMFTASHNPAQYNGIKMCRAGAVPIGQDTGLAEIRGMAGRYLDGDWAPSGRPKGSVTDRDLLGEYAAYLRTLVDLSDIRPLRAVADAGNGMAGLTVPRVFEGLPVEIVPMYFELDGTFPHHEANPIDPANLVDLQARVVEEGADIGLAFDGDADRCFVVDERGQAVNPSALTALIAVAELRRAPGSPVIHNLITSRAVPEIIREHGGTPVRTRVGHSFIKAVMAETGAVFGGEHSGHFYFRDFWRADSGMIAALHALRALGSQDGPLSALLAQYVRYCSSGEVNSTVADPAAKITEVETAYRDRPGVTTDHLDGLTVSADDWWFNLRPSNTEPLLRLNVEADDETTMDRVRDEVLAQVRG